MYPSIDDDDDLLAALCFDQCNGVEDPYAYIQIDHREIFSDLGSSGVNLQQEQEQVCNVKAQFCSVRVENNGGDVYSSSIGSSQLDMAATYSGVLQQEPCQVCSFRGRNKEDSVPDVQEQVCCDGTVKQEECSRKRGRTGSCSKLGTKACREKMKREKLNDRFMDLSSFLEPGRTLKTDKSALIDNAIRVVNHLRSEAHELKETNENLLEEIKILKAEKNELREEKMVLKSDKEKMEQQLKCMALHPSGFYPNKMAVYPSYGYYPNMQMWPYLHPTDSDTSHDHLKRPPAA